eukprot:11891709-Alexandrium_andersonii.AAC.1
MPHSIDLRYTKGHATEDHLVAGLSSPLLRAGNQASDAMVQRGKASIPLHHREALAWIQSRNEAYA